MITAEVVFPIIVLTAGVAFLGSPVVRACLDRKGERRKAVQEEAARPKLTESQTKTMAELEAEAEVLRLEASIERMKTDIAQARLARRIADRG